MLLHIQNKMNKRAGTPAVCLQFNEDGSFIPASQAGAVHTPSASGWIEPSHQGATPARPTMSNTSLLTTPAQASDINKIVEIHMRSFEGFFLTTLGKCFLRLYYDSVRRHPEGILLKCERDGQLIGFCAATIQAAGFNGRLVRGNILKYGMLSLRLLITRPRSLWHLFRNFSKEESNQGDFGDYAELLSIGVDPTIQNSGAGKQLISTLEHDVRKLGGTRLSLTTDFVDNEKAISFYKSAGYDVWYDFVAYPSRRMYRLIKTL